MLFSYIVKYFDDFAGEEMYEMGYAVCDSAAEIITNLEEAYGFSDEDLIELKIKSVQVNSKHILMLGHYTPEKANSLFETINEENDW